LKDFSQILLKTFKTTQQQNSCISTWCTNTWLILTF
jgi:hypothetical protein